MPWRYITKSRAAGDRRIFAEKPLADPQDIMAQLANEGPRPLYCLLAENKPHPPFPMIMDSCEILVGQGKILKGEARFHRRVPVFALDTGDPFRIRYTEVSDATDRLWWRQETFGPALRGTYLSWEGLRTAAKLWTLLRSFPGQSEAQLKQYCHYYWYSKYAMEVDRDILTELDLLHQDNKGRWYATGLDPAPAK